jgi:cytochrome c biogenesis protein CcmG/thiol:disulfide interchange protein DsbE
VARLALISDIHGNGVALEAVLADLERDEVDDVICLGDIAAGGPQPHQVIGRLRELGYRAVRGNGEGWLLDGLPPGASAETQRLGAIARWAREQLTREDLDYLNALPATLTASVGGLTVLCFHGSPRSDVESLMATTSDDALEEALAGAPAPLARLYEQPNRILEGGVEAFERRLAELRGYPVVVNKWASWCGPCRAEFPLFQRLSARLGKRVAFFGVDAQDSEDAAKTFLREYPVPYPSYSDPDQKVAELFGATLGFPSTAFYDSSGDLAYTKQGGYAKLADLEADIRRYALGGG